MEGTPRLHHHDSGTLAAFLAFKQELASKASDITHYTL
jgi:hypothetical protein